MLASKLVVNAPVLNHDVINRHNIDPVPIVPERFHEQIV